MSAERSGTACDLRAFRCEKHDRYPSRCPFLVAGVAGVRGRDDDPQPLALLPRRWPGCDDQLVGANLDDCTRVCCRLSDQSGGRSAPPFDAITTRSVPSQRR
jgi:hypothetical protein